MTNTQILKATEMASDCLGLHMLAGKHALCETVCAAKGDSSGNDAFHKDQDFVWISEYRAVKSIITKVHSGENPVYGTEDDNHSVFQNLPRHDSNQVKHQWWIPKPDRTDCLIHFVNECVSSGSDPLEIMFSSAKGRNNSRLEEKISIWKSYVTKASNKIDLQKLPDSVHYLHSMPSRTAYPVTNTDGGGTQFKEICTQRKETCSKGKASHTSNKLKTDKMTGEKRLVVEAIGDANNSNK
jgi:hypothetical protein